MRETVSVVTPVKLKHGGPWVGAGVHVVLVLEHLSHSASLSCTDVCGIDGVWELQVGACKDCVLLHGEQVHTAPQRCCSNWQTRDRLNERNVDSFNVLRSKKQTNKQTCWLARVNTYLCTSIRSMVKTHTAGIDGFEPFEWLVLVSCLFVCLVVCLFVCLFVCFS